MSNCPCDQSANMRATALRRPEEDPGLCSLRECGSVGGKTKGETRKKKRERRLNVYRNNNLHILKSSKMYYLASMAPS